MFKVRLLEKLPSANLLSYSTQSPVLFESRPNLMIGTGAPPATWRRLAHSALRVSEFQSTPLYHRSRPRVSTCLSTGAHFHLRTQHSRSGRISSRGHSQRNGSPVA